MLMNPLLAIFFISSVFYWIICDIRQLFIYLFLLVVYHLLT